MVKSLKDPRTASYVLATGIVLALGFALRSWGSIFHPPDLWADEAFWATRLIQDPLVNSGIRPIGYMWLCKQLLVFENNDLMLRLPSYLASLATLLFTYLSAKCLFKDRLVVFFCVFLVALHPPLISFAKEFKPYSFEIAVYSGLLFLALRSQQRGRTSSSLLIAAGVAIVFCYNVVFLYPSLLFIFLRQQPGVNHKHSRTVAAGFAVAILLLLIVLKMTTLSFLSEHVHESAQYWGTKYGVFPVDLGVQETFYWYFHKSVNLIAAPMALRPIHPLLKNTAIVGSIVFVGAYIAGVIGLIRKRRFVELFLFGSPVVFVMFANLLEVWPYGKFRTNFFLLPGTLLLGGCGLTFLMSQKRFARFAQVSVILVVILCFPLELNHLKEKQGWTFKSQHTEVLGDMQDRFDSDRHFQADLVIPFGHSWDPVFYYLKVDPTSQRNFADLQTVQLVHVEPTEERAIGAASDYPELERALDREYGLSAVRQGPTRVWIVVTEMDYFSRIYENPLVKQFSVYKNEFPTSNPRYFPHLIELQFDPRRLSIDSNEQATVRATPPTFEPPRPSVL